MKLQVNYDFIYMIDDLQSWRALMCFACVFSFVAVITTILSMECVKAIEKETKAKAFMSIISGGLVLASGKILRIFLLRICSTTNNC